MNYNLKDFLSICSISPDDILFIDDFNYHGEFTLTELLLAYDTEDLFVWKLDLYDGTLFIYVHDIFFYNND